LSSVIVKMALVASAWPKTVTFDITQMNISSANVLICLRDLTDAGVDSQCAKQLQKVAIPVGPKTGNGSAPT